MQSTWFGFAVVAWIVQLDGADGAEYCLTESFHARCEWNEVVLMRSARFGRMELGRCVTRNFGSVGCNADALSQLDFACSGRQSCDLSVSDPSLVRTKPCPLDFTSYLEATFECVPGINSYREECEDGGRLRVGISFGYLTSFWDRRAMITGPFGYGYTTTPAPVVLADDLLPCPLEFNVHPGQRINFTLLDFALGNRTAAHETRPGGVLGTGSLLSHADPEQKDCVRYAVIEEPISGSIFTVCGGEATGRREKFVFSSRSNFVLVRMTSSPHARFLLKFEVTGCANPTLPPDLHLKHQVDRLIAYCNRTAESFVLYCDGHRWKGQIRNCTTSKSGSVEKRNGEHQMDLLGLPHIGMSIAIILGVAMVTIVYVGIITVCALHIRRWRKHLNRPTKTEVDAASNMGTAASDLLRPFVEGSPACFKEKVILRPSNSGDCRFSEFFELQPSCDVETSYRRFYVDDPTTADGGPSRFFPPDLESGCCPDDRPTKRSRAQRTNRCPPNNITEQTTTMMMMTADDENYWPSQQTLCSASPDVVTEKTSVRCEDALCDF